ncbi:hypothetical protein HYX14_04350 [Candidatus Woesearchaeota archaeon]|nr:hypothetical protein [Candidatus Woesearchaeota archaeon]
MRFIAERRILLERPLNYLDEFLLRFIRILEKYVDYVIISGYISLLFGRSTEDVNLFMRFMDKAKFVALYHEFLDNNFHCLMVQDKIR